MSGWRNLASALAAQAHNNEYLWAHTEEEATWLDAAAAEIDATEWGTTPDDHSEALFLAYAMFRDPYDLVTTRKGVQKARTRRLAHRLPVANRAYHQRAD